MFYWKLVQNITSCLAASARVVMYGFQYVVKTPLGLGLLSLWSLPVTAHSSLYIVNFVIIVQLKL